MVLKGKTAIITGAAHGIGKAIARRYASEGANLVLADLDAPAIKVIANELSALALVADVSSDDGANEIVSKAVEKFGSLEILVNNAGITRDALVLRMKTESFDEVLKVNLRGPFLMSRAAAKFMIKARYGKIINMSSVVGIMGNAGQANYSASKAGLIALTKTLAKELGGRGVRVNAIAPGFIKTEMTEKLPVSAVEGFLNKVLLSGEPGTPGDVAETALFLASSISDYITGAVIPVDGGMLIA
ncbi:SDR family oxidoreductase [bacterium]|nr:SDR family oxidoreductase [bacterium]